LSRQWIPNLNPCRPCLRTNNLPSSMDAKVVLESSMLGTYHMTYIKL
jgi:hypothetical protein